MAKRAAKRRLALGLADQSDLRGIEPLGHRDFLVLGARHHRLEREVLLEHLATAAMHVTRGRADVAIGEAIEWLAQEINEPALALEQGEQGECAVAVVLRR